MEYVDNGNMLDFVNTNGELSEDHARHYFCQLISVLEYLHQRKQICHRDLKAENVLLDLNYNIRLIDFGLSNIFSEEDPFLKTACGSPAYACPEMIRGRPYTTSSDIWSAGILLYAMVHGELPYEDENMQRLMQKIIYTQPKYSASLSPPLRDLLQKMLLKDPQARITLEQIKEHTWFSQYQYADMMDMNFGSSFNWKVGLGNNPIDADVVNDMKMFGYDVTALTNDLLTGTTNNITAVYRMIRKNKISNSMVTISLNAQRSRKLQRSSATNSAKVAPRANLPGLPILKKGPPIPHPVVRASAGTKLSAAKKDSSVCRSNAGSVPRPPVAHLIQKPIDVNASRRKPQALMLVQRKRSNSLRENVLPMAPN